MEKKFSKTEIATIKRIAQNAAPFINKRDKIKAQLEEKRNTVEQQVREAVAKRIEKLEEKAKLAIEAQQHVIDSMQGYVKQLTGFDVEDLVTRKIEGTGKIDANTGKEIMKTTWVLKYPETVVPPMDEETEECSEAIPDEVLAEAEEEREEAEEAFAEQEADPFGNEVW